jgi:hypothetical protein
MKRRKPRRNGPAKEALLQVASILEEMSKRETQVHVMVLIRTILVSFESRVEKVHDSYRVTCSGFQIMLLPPAASSIMFSHTGGFALVRGDILVTVEPDAHSTEELLELYPTASTLIH